MKNLLLLLSFASPLLCLAQQPPFTPAKARMDAYEQRKNLESNSLFSNVKFRSVGPTVMSGRVADVDVSPVSPHIFYVAYASGGLWKTVNNGTSFTPLFDNEAVITIGDIAVDWKNKETIWLGSGENNSSRSSYSGTGIYKSKDGGKTWEQKGLEETHHIGRVILHPTDPNTVWVAALGHLYSPNKERGIYKTTDGGNTWKQTLFINENTGVIDLVIDPGNPDILYATGWQRERRAWNFSEGGKGSGIYKSSDGGKTWNLISSPSSGFPSGEGAGRIGLAVYRKNSNILYALIDNQVHRKEEKKPEDPKVLTKNKLKTISHEDFLTLDNKQINDFLDANNFPKEYNASGIKEDVRNKKMKPIVLAEYLEDANNALFDTPVTGAEVYRSDDAGASWKKTHASHLEDIYFTYGYYFGQIQVSPNNPDKIYLIGFHVLKSADAGKTFISLDAPNVHVDHHVLWIDPLIEGHLLNGNDGGLNISFDDGANWIKSNTPAVGQFYSVNVDMETPYNVYGGLQDNGVWYGPSTYEASTSWHANGHYPYKSLLGGDGMQVTLDTRDNTTVYAGFQFGNYYRIDKKTGERTDIKPKHKLGERPLRFNWQSPIHISIHNQDIIYFGSNKLHRSLNKAKDFEVISGDLTKGGKPGDIAYGTLTAIHESPLKFGLLYTGSDDGLVHLSRDGGSSWTNISSGLPKDMWVSRIAASAFEEGTVYISLNGYRWDDFTSYLYRSSNYGKTWEKIGKDLPAEPVNVVREDPKNVNLIYAGTDHGVYVSLNKGRSFMQMRNGLPVVAVHDLVIHPRDRDLVIGTHGRSIYIADIAPVQELNDSIMETEVFMFSLKKKTHSGSWGKRFSMWEDPKGPKQEIVFWLKEKGKTIVRIKAKEVVVKEFSDESERGLNYAEYDLSVDSLKLKEYESSLSENQKGSKPELADTKKYYLLPGKYTVEIETEGGRKTSKELIIEEPKKKKRE